jgi:hypothetical protein
VRAQIKIRSGQIIVEVDGQTFRELVRGMSEVLEILQIDECGCCGSTEVRPSYRKSGGYEFYELLCEKCTATLNLGVRQVDGRLFPRRKDDEGNTLPNGGWKVYRGGGRTDGEDSDWGTPPPPPRK